MKKFIFPSLGYIAILFFIFYPALYTPDGQLLFGDDIHRQYYFFRVFFQKSIAHGVIPWWNPYIFSGVPFMANAQVSYGYPGNWLYIVLPLTRAFPIFMMVHILIAMVSMYWMSGLFIRSKIARWAGGIIFGLSGYFFGRIVGGQPDVVASAAYMPLVFGLFWRVLTQPSKKNIIWAGLGLGLQMLIGYQINTLYTLEAVGIALLIQCARTKNFSAIVPVITVGVIGLGVAAVTILPTAEFISNSIRTFFLPYEWSAQYAHRITDLKTLLDPFAYGDYFSYHGSAPYYHEHAAYIGRVALGLAVFVVLFKLFLLFSVRKKRKKTVDDTIIWVLIAVSLFGLWMSLAGNAPVDLYRLLWKIIPLYRAVRVPSRHLILLVFGLASLTAISLGIIRQRVIQILLVIVILIELVPFAKMHILTKPLPQSRHDPELLNILKSDSEPYRMLPNFGVWIAPRDSLDFESPMLYDYFSATGYDPSILKNYYEAIDAVNGNLPGSSIRQHDVQVPYLNVFSRSVDFLNIKYVLAPTAYDPIAGISNDRFTLLRQDNVREYRLYENKTVMPRFFFVRSIIKLPNRSSVAKVFIENRADFTDAVYIDGSKNMVNDVLSNCPPNEKGTVQIQSYTPNAIQLAVSTPCNGVLTSSEVMYPGWEATIDGKRVNLFEGNLAFRTLLVPKGRHDLVLRYNPEIFIIGGMITLLTATSMMLWLYRIHE